MADEALRAEGKTLYETGRWTEAIAKYGAYIELLLEERESDGRLVVGYSNRAQAWLKLEMYADALGDTERALNLDTLHLKSLVKNAKALEGLKCYRDAVAVYTNLLGRSDLNANDALAIRDSLRDAGMKDRQTRLGQFEDPVSDWCNSKTRQEKIEEFVGPVELRRVSGMDRGLFATRDVDPGELLLVSLPITSFRHPRRSQPAQRAELSLLSGLEKKVTHACQNVKDFSQAQVLVQLDALAGPYPTGPLLRDCPPMRYFTPVNVLAPHLRKLTTEDLQNPVFTRAFFSTFMLFKVACSRQYINVEGAGQHEYITGIYCLPSFIKHSCFPNVSSSCQGSGPQATIALFFRASRSIRKGDELLSSYTDIVCPFHDRRIISRDTICNCARCVLEERLLEGVPDLGKLERRCSALWQRRSVIGTCEGGMIQTSEGKQMTVRTRCIESIKSVEQLLQSNSKLQVLNTTEKDWIRASFIHFYRLLLEPTFGLSPSSSESDQLLQLRLMREAVRVIRTVDPASGAAMAISSEAFRQISAWIEINTSQSGRSTRFDDLTPASVEITLLMKELQTEGVETGRLLYGPQVKEQALNTLFFSGGRLLLRSQHSWGFYRQIIGPALASWHA